MRLIPRDKGDEGYSVCEDFLEQIRADIFKDKQLTMNKDACDELIIYLSKHGYLQIGDKE